MTTPPLTNLDPALRAYWHPVARVDEVTGEPRRVVVLGEALVVVRLDGEAVVLADRCPHRNARFSDGTVVDGDLRCPYHGWRFDGGGRCTLIPALGPGAAAATLVQAPGPAVREVNGLVMVALDPPRHEPLPIPEWGVPGTDPAWLPTLSVPIGAGQFVDNFLDFAHFPFVHDGTFGAGEDEHIDDYDVERLPNGLRVRYEHLINNHEDPLVATGEHPLLQPRIMEYTYRVPFSVRLRLEYPLASVENTIVAWAVPETAASTVLHQVLLRNDIDSPEAAQSSVDYELRVLAEDLAVLEHLPDRDLPLHLPSQSHTRADRITVELRRLLRDAVAAATSPEPAAPTHPSDPIEVAVAVPSSAAAHRSATTVAPAPPERP